MHLRMLRSASPSTPRFLAPRGNLGSGELGWERSEASLAEDVGERDPLREMPGLPVPLRGRAGSAAASANRVPGAALRSVSPGKESKLGGAAGPRTGEGVVQRNLGGARAARPGSSEQRK